MKIVRFSELGHHVREEMKGARWILLHQDEIPDALGALMFAELDGVLAAVIIETQFPMMDYGDVPSICSSFLKIKMQMKFARKVESQRS